MCETSKQGEYSLKCNYPKESEATVNSLINLLFTGTYECHAMAYYFMNDQVAQRGLAKLHKHLANAQYELVEKLMRYQVLRGGRVKLGDIKAPSETEWSAKSSLECCFQKFKNYDDEFLKAHLIAIKTNDAHFARFVQHELIDRVVDALLCIKTTLTTLSRIGDSGIEQYVFDRDLLVWLKIREEKRRCEESSKWTSRSTSASTWTRQHSSE